MKETFKSNRLVIFSIIVMFILSLALISLGFFTPAITEGSIFSTTGNADASDVPDFTFSELSSGINLTGKYPMTDEVGMTTDSYTFSITNNETSSWIKYEIIMEAKEGNTLSDNLVSTNLGGGLTTGTETAATTSGYSKGYVIATSYLNKSGSGYNSTNIDLKIWINENGTIENAQNKTWVGKIIVKAVKGAPTYLTYSEYSPKFGTDTSKANMPKLVDNLIPVVYDEANDEWIKASTTQSGWYNYDNQIWANAVTTTDENRSLYNVADPGTIIPMSDILGMYVWIPRYEYQYTNLGTSYAGGTAAQPGGIGINFISGTSTTETTNYIIHPAFRNGSVNYTNNAYTTTTPYQMGGWDSEITGFWYAKFETTGSATEPTSKPNLQSLVQQTVGEQFATSQLVSSYQGINLDSHMSKNSEWGAVSYLSQSTYGKYGNSAYTGANKEIYINNSSSYYTGRSMGLPAGATGSTNTTNGSYEYNDTQNGSEINGIGASTTGNIYGVYDMVGGANEYVMGNYNKTVASSNLAFPNAKYYDIYTTDTATTACGGKICYGHGLSEISGWYSDSITMISSSYPWFHRGAYYIYYDGTYAGVWFSGYHYGSAGGNLGFRAVLI